MSHSGPENRLVIDWDIKRKRIQLSAAGVVGVIGLLAILIGIAVLSRML